MNADPVASNAAIPDEVWFPVSQAAPTVAARSAHGFRSRLNGPWAFWAAFSRLTFSDDQSSAMLYSGYTWYIRAGLDKRQATPKKKAQSGVWIRQLSCFSEPFFYLHADVAGP
jgi:hypothetical protein